MKPTRIAISGYYGFNNTGDEAVLAGIVKSLQIEADKRRIPIEIDVLSINPDITRSIHGTRASHRYRLGPLAGSIAKCDLLLSGGGSLFQDVTSAHGIYYYAAVVRLAQMLGKKTMFIAQGIGPLTNKRSLKLVAGVANRLDAITTRDTESMTLLREIGVDKPAVEVTADPALILPELENRRRAAGDVLRIGVSLRPWAADMDAVIDNIVAALKTLETPVEIVPIAMQPESDRSVMNRFAEKCMNLPHAVIPISGAMPAPHLNEVIESISSCGLVIGMRLHALILAAGAGIPSLAISYDPKVDSFMRASSQADYICRIDSPGDIPGRFKQLADNRERQTDVLFDRAIEMRKSAMRNAGIALDIIANKET